MRIDPAGLPFIGGALALAIVSGAAVTWALAVPFLAIGAFFLFFFRDPDRISPEGDNVVVSPADGRVLVAGDAIAESAPPGTWRQVSIFLSPADVHVNRVPVSGTVSMWPDSAMPPGGPRCATSARLATQAASV